MSILFIFFNFIPHARHFVSQLDMKVYALTALSMSFTFYFDTGTIFFVTISHVNIPPDFISIRYSPLVYIIPAIIMNNAGKVPSKGPSPDDFLLLEFSQRSLQKFQSLPIRSKEKEVLQTTPQRPWLIRQRYNPSSL